MWGRRSCNFSPTCRLHKNRTPEMMNIFVTYFNIRYKNYLNLLYKDFNRPQGEVVPYQRVAIAIFKKSICKFKKIINKDYCSFLTVIVSDFVSIIHSNCSPFFKSSISLANAGTVVVNEPATDCIFVLYFNSIPPKYVFLYINMLIYLLTNIYNFLYKNPYRNLYILIS